VSTYRSVSKPVSQISRPVSALLWTVGEACHVMSGYSDPHVTPRIYSHSRADGRLRQPRVGVSVRGLEIRIHAANSSEELNPVIRNRENRIRAERKMAYRAGDHLDTQSSTTVAALQSVELDPRSRVAACRPEAWTACRYRRHASTRIDQTHSSIGRINQRERPRKGADVRSPCASLWQIKFHPDYFPIVPSVRSMRIASRPAG